MKSILNVVLLALSISLFCTTSLLANQSEQYSLEKITKEQQKAGKVYLPSPDPLLDIEQTLVQAKANGKLAIIALGANWCHDSQSFAKKMFKPKFKALREKHYQLLFVDVGYLTKIKPAITKLGHPVIYATPTVLVIDPSNNVQLNQHNMFVWRDAAKLSTRETIDYFTQFVNKQPISKHENRDSQNAQTQRLAKLNQQIDDFQQRQAERLYRAFDIIGPMLEREENGESVDEFNAYWRKVAKYRYQLMDDLEKLNAKALELSESQDSNLSLDFPEYPLFEWEK